MANVEKYFEYSDLGHCGPSEDAAHELYLVREGDSRLSSGQKVLLKVAFDLWNGSGGASFHDIREWLDAAIVQSIGELMMSASQDDPSLLDHWEETWGKYDPSAELTKA
jgi:hypothetical protein